MPQARDDNFQAIGMTIGHALRIKNAARLMTNLLRRFSCGNAHVRQFGEGVESGRQSSSENLEQDVLRFVFKRFNSSQLSCCLSVYLSICLSVCLRLNVVFELRLHVAYALRFFHCLRGIVWNTKRCEQSGHGAGGTTKLQGQRLCNQSCRPNSSWP